jgi:hypothetical protein
MMLPMGDLIVVGVLVVVMSCVLLLFAYWFIPANERRLASRKQPGRDPRAEHDERMAIRFATTAPEDCSHDDVLEDWHPALESREPLGLAPPAAAIVNHGGRCRKCAARVIRHGGPGSWTPWMVDPADPEYDA